MYFALPNRLAPNKWVAALVLGFCGKPAVPTLIKALDSDDQIVSQSAAAGLYKVGRDAEEAMPALIRVLKGQSNNYRLREAAIGALAKMGTGTSAAMEVLTAELTRKPSLCPQEAAYALGEMGPAAQAAVPALEAALKSDNDWVRRAAAEALKKIRGEEPPK
jgi:HEAT repeat protein